jgi:hypothetical protein
MALANLSILKTGKARAIRFSTLDAICEALSCQPGDLLRFELARSTRPPPPRRSPFLPPSPGSPVCAGKSSPSLTPSRVGHFRVELSPLQSTRALRLHRPLRGRHAVHRLCAKPACARTGAQQRPWCEVHRGPASGTAGVSGSVPVCGEGAGTRARREATYSRAERRVGRQRETTPPLNQHFQRPLCSVVLLRRWSSSVRLDSQLGRCGVTREERVSRATPRAGGADGPRAARPDRAD